MYFLGEHKILRIQNVENKLERVLEGVQLKIMGI